MPARASILKKSNPKAHPGVEAKAASRLNEVLDAEAFKALIQAAVAENLRSGRG